MKVSIGSKFVEGPYGGGNLFVKNLSKYLIKKGVDVVYDLRDIDIDIILIINPLKSSEMSTFNHFYDHGELSTRLHSMANDMWYDFLSYRLKGETNNSFK